MNFSTELKVRMLVPNYEFRNKNGETVEKYFKVADAPDKIKIKNRNYYRIVSLPSVLVDTKKPKTLGQLASKNTEEMLKRGDPRVQQKASKKPWWRKGKVDLSLSKLSKKKQLEYIKTGKK